MTRSYRFRALLLLASISLAVLGACSEDDADEAAEDADEVAEDVNDAVDDASYDAIETAARNIAATQGEEEFSAANVEVDGDLSCEADADENADAVNISCTGTSTDGRELALEGTTDEIPGASVTELEGSFVGKASGTEVFTVDTLGD